MSDTSYIIVGAGVFGVSTALHLIRKYPHSHITLVDRDGPDAPTRVAASWDWNKVVRADYTDITYMRLALEARDVWKSDPLWRPFYHETGIFWVARSAFAGRVVQNYRELGVRGELYACTVEEARGEYGGLFADGDYQDITEVLVNKTSGLADAKDALKRVIEEALMLGVTFVGAEVEGLEFEDGGRGACTGVRTKAGDTITAERTILCTGAFTPRLLMDSAPERPDLHAGDRIVATGITEAVAPLTKEQFQKYRDMPVTSTDNPPGRGNVTTDLPRDFLMHCHTILTVTQASTTAACLTIKRACSSSGARPSSETHTNIIPRRRRCRCRR